MRISTLVRVVEDSVISNAPKAKAVAVKATNKSRFALSNVLAAAARKAAPRSAVPSTELR